MGFKKGNIVIKVQQSARGGRQVNETGLDEPLAIFDDNNQVFE